MRGGNAELDVVLIPPLDYSEGNNIWLAVTVDARGPWDGHLCLDTQTPETGRHWNHHSLRIRPPETWSLAPLQSLPLPRRQIALRTIVEEDAVDEPPPAAAPTPDERKPGKGKKRKKKAVLGYER
jgi:hypothetical protein